VSTGQIPSGPYDRPLGPPDPYGPGPAGEPDRPPGPPRSGGRLPVLFSGLALIVALVAAGVSLFALSRTGDQPVAAPTPTVVPTADGPVVTTAPPTGATGITDPSTEPPTEATGVPDPHGTYTPVYQQKALRLQPSNQRYIDVDKPSADADGTRGEFQYSDTYTPPKMLFNQLTVAKLTNTDGSPGDCAEQLDSAPIDGQFTPAKGDLICVLTDANKAVDEGITRKLALLRVDAIAPDGTMNLTVNAWSVPS
jgi:hypothetical protein